MENKSVDDLLKQKRGAKAEILKTLGLAGKKPLLGIFLDQELSDELEQQLVSILEGVRALDVDVVILADSNIDSLSKIAIILPYDRKNRSKLLCASDMALVFDFSDVGEMLIHGAIPVTFERPEVADYNPNRETGNSFVYKNNDLWSMFAALVRARETFKFPYDWKHIVKQGLEGLESA